MTTTAKPRRSPRNHNSSETAAKKHPLSKGDQQSTTGTHITNKKDPKLRNTTTLRPTSEATVKSKAAAKTSPKSKDKAKAVVQSSRGTSGRPKSADPVPPPSSTRHLRPGRGPKVSAKSKQRAERDPERSASRHRTKRRSGKADDPRKTSAIIGRGTQSKVSSKSITELIPAPADSVEAFHAEEPQVGPVQEDPCASGSHQLLTEEALEELTRSLEFDPTNRNRSVEEPEDGSSQGIDIDSQERLNHKRGYVPPLDEETIRIIEAIIQNPARAETMVGIGPEKQEFLSGLRSRNVNPYPSTHADPLEEEIQSISLEGYLQETQEQETSHEELWKSDKAKCTPDSSEALYQRTLMINLIARHCLIYQFDSSKQQIFDFSVEEPWGCQPMPSRDLWREVGGKFLTQPKPDLAVCFKREAVISDIMWQTLPKATRGLACFENITSNESRIFHFLAVEAKRAMFNLNSPQALHQCLNNASQALHNMFEFFRDAGREHEQVFYDKVRFFSVVANRDGIIVRIHRAIKLPDDANPFQLIMPDQVDYRLKFEFREFQRITEADEFSRKKVLEVVKKILKYATDDLSKMINAAASELVQKLNKDYGMYDARSKADFYLHGEPPKSSKRTSAVQSTMGDGVQRQFQSAKLSGQTTPNGLAPNAKKRGGDEMELDGHRRRMLPCSNSGLSLPSSATASNTVGSQRGRRVRAVADARTLRT